MTLEPLCLFTSYKERLIFFMIITAVLALNLSWKYMHYMDFKKEEFVRIEATVINIYDKSEFNIVQFKAQDYRFFTQVNNHIDIKKQEVYSVVLLSDGIGFLDFIKGFYTQTVLHEALRKQTFKLDIKRYLESQHEDISIQELFLALFLAIPLSSEFKEYFSVLSISHLIDIFYNFTLYSLKYYTMLCIRLYPSYYKKVY